MIRRAGEFAYQVEPLFREGRLVDLLLLVGGETWHLAGRDGEESLARGAEDAARAGLLPVFLGCGLGAGLARWLALGAGPAVVVDKESPIYQASGARQALAEGAPVLWLDHPDPALAARLVRAAAARWGAPGWRVIAHPVYRRLDPTYYQALARDLAGPGPRPDDPLRRPRFSSWPPRVLLLACGLFINEEITAGLEQAGMPHRLLFFRKQGEEAKAYLGAVREAVAGFRPDFILAVNHVGLDTGGLLQDLAARLELPIASWFVDNPWLQLGLHARPAHGPVAAFCWDKRHLPALTAAGFAAAFWLPLATNPARFCPGPAPPPGHPFHCRVAFVGNSMLDKVAGRLELAAAPAGLGRRFSALAAEFAAGDQADPLAFLREAGGRDWLDFQRDAGPERALALATAVVWEATRAYRLDCVQRALAFGPLVAGDTGWRRALAGARQPWRWHGPVSYYDQLPAFYRAARLNLNSTSLQMRGAVNQRVFDAPAVGAFVLSDQAEDLAELFDPGPECATYGSPEDIPDAIERWLSDPAGRQAVALAARRRILAKHTWAQRLLSMARAMRRTFA